MLGTRVAAIAYVKGKDLAGLGIHSNPHPLFVGFLLAKLASASASTARRWISTSC
jgi:hypothetical protein